MFLIPYHFKTQEMSDAAVMKDSCALEFVSHHFKTQETCDDAVMEDPCLLEFVPEHFKTQEICDKAVIDDSTSLLFGPDWFVSQQKIKSWHDDDDFYNYDDIIEWYNGYLKRTAQKVKIKEELMPIVWHLSRWWNWCMSEDDKRPWN